MKSQFINEERLGYVPNVIYHFTKKENLEIIMKDRTIKHFSDIYTFYCPTEEEAKWFLYNVTCNPKATRVGLDGIRRKNNNKIEEFVLLKIIPDRNYLDNSKWFKSNSTRNEEIDRHVICYKGNVRINSAEIYELSEVDIALEQFIIWAYHMGSVNVNGEKLDSDDFINMIFSNEDIEITKVKVKDNQWIIEDSLNREFTIKENVESDWDVTPVLEGEMPF
ncbi:hypothetical protein [Clostridium sp.]|uniref:hypothetical protein n=1 Tax=Clostridium sp. TaxID=1506 RepID=UPI00260EF988|nr:hypothetical protein [Clostridium sp.]